MTGLQMIECHLEEIALMRFLRAQGLVNTRQELDLGYGVHAWLKAAFGEFTPCPWRLFSDQRRPARVLAYSTSPDEILRERLRDFAEPMVQAICPPETIAGKPMSSWSPGRRLGFQLLCCPIGRQARRKVEKDIFLLAADHTPEERLDRAKIYCDWAKEKLQAVGAVQVERIRLEGFRRVRQQRKTGLASGTREIRRLERPEAVLAGVLQVTDPQGFNRLLAHGIGRHRAFGYGMLLVRPPER